MRNSAVIPKKAWIAIRISILLIILLCAYIFINKAMFDNYAEDAAKPIEAALVRSGAAKMCSRGDAGKGPDNDEPWYTAVYEAPGGMNEAIELVKRAANQSGFNLVEGDLSPNPEDNKFYSDRTTKESSYNDLKDGPLELKIKLYGSKAYDKASPFCAVSPEGYNGKATTISFSISLPEYKK